MSLGFDLLLSTANVLVGIGAIIVGVIVITSPIPGMVDLTYLGLGCIPAGILALATGIFGFIGGFQESVGCLKAAMYMACLALVSAGGLLSYALIVSGSYKSAARKGWAAAGTPGQEKIEEKFVCCGFSHLSERTHGCRSKTTCSDPVARELKGQYKMLVIVLAICTGAQLGELVCSFCLCSRMQSQQRRAAHKNAKKMAEEGRRAAKKKAKREKKMSKQMAKAAQKGRRDRERDNAAS